MKTTKRAPIVDPRTVGCVYRDSYDETCTVLAITDYPDWRGRTFRVRWASDGSIHEHGTAWEPRRNRVISQPSA